MRSRQAGKWTGRQNAAGCRTIIGNAPTTSAIVASLSRSLFPPLPAKEFGMTITIPMHLCAKIKAPSIAQEPASLRMTANSLSLETKTNFVVGADHAGRRLDHFLVPQLPDPAVRESSSSSRSKKFWSMGNLPRLRCCCAEANRLKSSAKLNGLHCAQSAEEIPLMLFMKMTISPSSISQLE